jgi:hypothetical protein
MEIAEAHAMSVPIAAPNDCPQPPGFRASLTTLILHEACQTAGGVGQLATLLRVSSISLTWWLDGEEEAPAEVYQACIDIVLLHDGPLGGGLAPGSAR